jgi:hypothetical protein
MYSPSGLFQLQALQSLTPGKNHTRFNLNVLLRAFLANRNSPPPGRKNRPGGGEFLQPERHST